MLAARLICGHDLMIARFAPIIALLLSVGLLQTANGLFVVLLGLRMVAEPFPATITGLVMSAYFLGLMIGSLICRQLIEAVGRIRGFAAFASIVSACAIAHAIWVDPLYWASLRFITGICMGGIFMVAESWLNGSVDNRRRGQLLAIYMLCNYVPMGLGQQILNFGDPGNFILFSVASILFSFALIPLAVAPSVSAGPLPKSRLSILQLFKISPLGVIAAIAAGLVSSVFFSMTPVFGRGIGLSLSQIATLMTSGLIGGLLMQWPIGKTSDIFDRRSVFIALVFALACTAVLLTQITSLGYSALVVGIVIYGGMNFALYPLALAHTNDFLDADDVVPASAGMILAYSIGASLGPTLAGQTMALLGPTGIFYYTALIMGPLGLFAIFRATQRAAPSKADQGPFVPVPRMSVAGSALDPRAAGPADTEIENPQSEALDKPA
jgi:MFS family permease